MKSKLLLMVMVSITGLCFGNLIDEDFSGLTLNTAAGLDDLAKSDVTGVADPTAVNWWRGPRSGNNWTLSSTGGNADEWITKNNYSQANSASIWAVVQNNQALTGIRELSFDLKLNAGDFAVRVWGLQDASFTNVFKTTGGSGLFGPELAMNYEGTGASQLLNKSSRLGDFSTNANFQAISYDVDFGSGYDWILVGFAQGRTTDGAASVGVDNVVVIPEPATLGLLSLLGGGMVAFRRIFRG